MYKYNFLRKTEAERRHQNWYDRTRRVEKLMRKGCSLREISEILHLSVSSVRGLMTDIDDETLREIGWVK